MSVLSLLMMVLSSTATAAQPGNIIVDDAKVYQYPRSDSQIISTLPKNTQVVLSNQPTEGYFKARLPNGQLGWISGHEVLAGGAAPPPQLPEKKSDMPPPARPRPDSEEEEDELGKFRSQRIRLLVGYGLSNLTYGGLKDEFTGVDLMNYGTTFQIELQKKIWSLLHWAIRVETYSTNSGEKELENGDIQTISNFMLPVQIGFVFSPINFRKIRIGIGAYGGVALAAGTTVTVSGDSSGTNLEASTKYTSMDPVGTLSGQITWMLSNNFGIFADGAYHYQKTSLFPASDSLGADGFAIDYTGYTGRLGLEMRF